MASNTSQSTIEQSTNRYQKQMKDIIEGLHNFFAYGRIGGIRAKEFPNYLQSHANKNFKTSQKVEKFTADLYNTVRLAKQLCDLSLAIPDDDNNNSNSKELLPNGFWADVVRQLRRIIQLWLRMDEVFAHLAREQSDNAAAAATSCDGLKFIQDDIYATSLLHYLKMLNLFAGGDYLVHLFVWCKATNSLITILNEALSREEKKKPPKWRGRSAGVSK